MGRGHAGKRRERDSSRREGRWLPGRGEIQRWWHPASGLHSRMVTAKQGDKAPFPVLPSPSPAEPQRVASVLPTGVLPTGTFPLFGYLPRLPLPTLLLGDQITSVLVAGIWAINTCELGFAGHHAPSGSLQKHKVISCSRRRGRQRSRPLWWHRIRLHGGFLVNYFSWEITRLIFGAGEGGEDCIFSFCLNMKQ